MSTSENTTSTTQTETTGSTHHTTSSAKAHDENRWVTRFEDLLKVKNLDELKDELKKLADEIQTEIQHFDIQEHLSPSAKERLHTLEKRYSEIMGAVTKAQRQFDREFNKNLRILKRTQADAQKQILNLKNRVLRHRGDILKASKSISQKIKKTTKSKVSKVKKAKTRKTRAK